MGWECEVCPLEVGIWPLLGWKEQQSLYQVGILLHQSVCWRGQVCSREGIFAEEDPKT